MNIGIIGQGFVGNAIFQKFKSFYNVYTFDLIKSKSNCDLDQMSKNCSIIFICLPTPMNHNGSCNIDNLLSVLRDLESLSYDQVVVVKSTIVPGTTDKLNKSFPKIDIMHNPEFLTEKNAVKDFEKLLDLIDDITGSWSIEYAKVSIFFLRSFKTSSIILWGFKLVVLPTISSLIYCFIDAL